MYESKRSKRSKRSNVLLYIFAEHADEEEVLKRYRYYREIFEEYGIVHEDWIDTIALQMAPTVTWRYEGRESDREILKREVLQHVEDLKDGYLYKNIRVIGSKESIKQNRKENKHCPEGN